MRWKTGLREIIHFLELEKKLSSSVDHLSGGEKQRTALARALIIPPRLLFLDEPFSCLDEKTRKRARLLTSQVAKKYSIPFLLISHDKEDIRDLADEEFFLKGGKIHKRQR